MRGAEAGGHQAVVLQGVLGALQDGGHVAVHIAHHQFVDLGLCGIGDQLMVRLEIGVMSFHLVCLVHASAHEERVALVVQQAELHDGPSAGVAAGELVPGLVQEPDLETGGVGIATGLHQVHLHRTLQDGEAAHDGAVELHIGGLHPERGRIVLQHLHHVRVATHQVVQAERGMTGQEHVFRRQYDAVLKTRYVAAPAVLFGARVDGVLPLVPGGLLHELIAGEVALQVDGLGDQGVAAGAHPAIDDVLRIARAEAHEELHDVGVDHVILIRPPDTVRGEHEIATEACARRVGILHVAGQAAHAVQPDGAGVQHGGGEGRMAQHAFLVHAHGCMAAQALVLDGGLVAGVHQHLVFQLGPEERVPGAVGHEGAPPVVRDVHVAARAVHAGDTQGIAAMAAGATAAGGEERAVQHGQIGGTTGPVDGQRGTGVVPALTSGLGGTPSGEREDHEGDHRQDDVSVLRSHGGEVSAGG